MNTMLNIVLLLLILIGVVILLITQNKGYKANIEGFIHRRVHEEGVQEIGVRELNNWAGYKRTKLNKYCTNLSDRGGKLNNGQHCVANCAPIVGKTGWMPGDKIIKKGNGFQWKNQLIRNSYEFPSPGAYCSEYLPRGGS